MIPCCQNPNSFTNVDSPFTKIIALGFYDGPTGGILQCATCRSVYRFDMLDWDEDQNVRIFRLAWLPPECLQVCISALSQDGTAPQWPVWVPGRPAKESLLQAMDQAMFRLFANAQPADLVVAWSGYGEKTLAARKIAPQELDDVPDWFSREESDQERDWFAVLGLAKKRPQSGPEISTAS